MEKTNKKGKWIVFIIIIGIIAAIFFFRGWIWVAVREYMTAKRLSPVITDIPEGTAYLDYSVIEADNERLKEELSDIEGMSRYDKLQDGLDIIDDSDSDGDGLTDKEEIEVYGSDPLRSSTSGDLYSDSYKVKKGMDPLQYIEYEGDSVITDDSGFISIYAKTPYDIGGIDDPSCLSPRSKGAVIYDCTTEVSDEMKGNGGIHVHYCISDCIYKAYKVSGYDGDTIDIDIGAISDTIGRNPKELDVEAYAKQTGAKIKKSRNANTISLHITEENHEEGSPFNIYEIYIVDSMSIKAANAVKSGGEILTDVKTGITSKEYNENAGLIVISTAATAFLKLPPKIFCAEDATEEERTILLNEATRLYQSVFYQPIWVERPVCDESYLTYVSRRKIEYFNELCYKLLGQRNNVHYLGTADPKDRLLWLGFENYGDFYNDQILAMEEEALAEQKRQSEEEAFFFKDEFGFDNFTSPYTGGGVCMGMARVAAEVFNDGSVLTSAAQMHSERDFVAEKGHEVQFNLNDERCGEWTKTFFDRYIADYEYGKELKTEDADEDEVIKMLSWYWADGNQRMNSNNDMSKTYLNRARGAVLDWETVEKAVEELDNGKVLLCGLNINNRSNKGHIINLVSYSRIDDSYLSRNDMGLEIDGGIRFRVYDSNFSNNFGYLSCYKYTYPDGGSIMLYEYDAPKSGGEKPQNYGSQFLCNGDIMEAQAMDNGFPEIFFIIMTEDCNMLNVQYQRQK